jgi:hypothetical protein
MAAYRKKRWMIVTTAMLCVAALVLALFLYRKDHRLPYQDHFSDGKMDEWTAFGGAWQLNNSYILNDSDDIGAKLITGSKTLSNYRMTSDIRLTNSFGDAGLIVRVRDEEEGTNAFNGYYAGIRLPNQLLVGKMDFGFRPMARVVLKEVARPGIWYSLSVEVRGCTVIATARSSDGRLLATATTTDTETCDRQGAFGLRSFEAGGSWKNIRVEEIP